MVALASSFYQFDLRRIASWTTAQEKSIAQDYPFLVDNENPEDYVARAYLQFLWLPESLMPLHLLVPSLRRASVPSTSNSDASVHPMHAILEPLLLKTRSLSDKYHVEFPQILADGGGEGEMEETMMWYALAHEKAQEGKDNAEDLWSDDVWREAYLERMERREVQIQILLYFYKLSLPGPPPPPPKLPKKKRSRRSGEPAEHILTPEEQLEAYMDKLSMWQLVGNLDPTPAKKVVERDWTQMFVENVVERHFKSQLPELCALLRSKMFPSSPFSEDEKEDSPASRPASPEQPVSQSRLPSPTLSTSSRTTAKLSSRARSRSISVSLAQEQEERERASAAPPKKRILNREVSMSRVFKPKPKRPVGVPAAVKNEAPAPPKPQPKATDTVLVDETPQKPRTLSVRTMSFGQPAFGLAAGKLPAMINSTEDDDEEEWMIDSSPDIVMLNPTRGSSASSGLVGMDSDGDGDEVAAQATPSKPSGKRRRC